MQDGEITVLLQIPDLENFFLVCIPTDMPSRNFSNPILHRATAKASSVNLDVKFLGRLKKPVMTKRASLGASSVSGVNGKSA